MHKLLIIIFFLSTITFSSADENLVKEIEINGNQRIDIETIISYSNIKLNDNYTDEKGNEILKTYLILNFFQI